MTGRDYTHFSMDAEAEATVLHVEGDVDLSSASMLATAIADGYRPNRRLIVDMRRVHFLDGAGIRVLESAAREHPGRFVVAGPSPAIHRLFAILNLLDAVPVVASLDVARETRGLNRRPLSAVLRALIPSTAVLVAAEGVALAGLLISLLAILRLSSGDQRTQTSPKISKLA
ncbi:MAG TPA: STAS domain-containing protein [bacterium]|nr:STAS domain-containing protein [bacterium]